MPDQERPNLP